MSDASKDGGSAFPESCAGQGLAANVSQGMSLRDYFAAHAPISLHDVAQAAANVREQVHGANDDAIIAGMFTAISKLRYEYTDAMLSARSNP